MHGAGSRWRTLGRAQPQRIHAQIGDESTESVAFAEPMSQDPYVSEPILDDINKRLIEHLQRDGRMSYAGLAKVVGLSEAAVRQRVQRLLDNGVMQIVAVTDPLSLGFARQVMVGLKVEGDMRSVAGALASIAEVDYVVICAGAYDLLAELVCTDDDHLLDLLNDQIRAIPGVTGTETFVYLKLAKQTYAWGTR
jgi:Lrp/AsnC family transcriptional regulator for asnA, asnC and gidA